MHICAFMNNYYNQKSIPFVTHDFVFFQNFIAGYWCLSIKLFSPVKHPSNEIFHILKTQRFQK